jgi:hypothetical protein
LVAAHVQDRESRRRQYPGPNHPCYHDECRGRQTKTGWHFLTGIAFAFVRIAPFVYFSHQRSQRKMEKDRIMGNIIKKSMKFE